MTQQENRREWLIGEAAQRAGVSVRAMRHYDQLGLLAPSRVTHAGYRYYDEAAMLRLEQILYFKELGFSLEEIHAIMSDGGYDAKEAMRRQRALLVLQRERIDAMIARLDEAVRGEGKAKPEVFNMKDIETMKAQYAQEVKERWGGTQAYAQSEKKTAAYGKADWQNVQAGMTALMEQFAAVRDLPAEDRAVQALVHDWKAYITANFYECTDEILRGLGQMYTADERFMANIDRCGEGTAACMSRAIAAYCKEKGV